MVKKFSDSLILVLHFADWLCTYIAAALFMIKYKQSLGLSFWATPSI